jgi:putative ABC transport system ATP-binding protein
MAIVEIRDLEKTFNADSSEPIRVLQDLNLDVEEGEFVALMGPSGSGKTTLLNLIAGLDTPTAGTIRVGDQEISSMSESELARWRTRNVGFVFQFYNLLPVLTAYENVELPLLLLPMSGSERRQKVTNALEIVGLADRMKHRPGKLSGGQCQRVGIARAIVTDPTIIVCDEPTGALDAKSADNALKLLDLLRLELGKTIVMVTHDPHAAERAQRIIHLEKGQLVGDGRGLPQLA